MSIRLINKVFESETLGPTERLIMLALADHADESGRCYPSIHRLCKRTGLKERSVQANLKKLSDQGYLKTIIGGGKGKANLYMVFPYPAADAPKPLGTIIESSDVIAGATPADILAEVASTKASRSFITYRAQMKKPLTATGARRLASSLNRISAKGGDPDDALGMVEERGWQSIEPHWYFKEQKNARKTIHSSRSQYARDGQQPSGLAGAAMRRRAAREQGHES